MVQSNDPLQTGNMPTEDLKSLQKYCQAEAAKLQSMAAKLGKEIKRRNREQLSQKS